VQAGLFLKRSGSPSTIVMAKALKAVLVDAHSEVADKAASRASKLEKEDSDEEDGKRAHT